jgi:hypothetical protein
MRHTARCVMNARIPQRFIRAGAEPAMSEYIVILQPFASSTQKKRRRMPTLLLVKPVGFRC